MDKINQADFEHKILNFPWKLKQKKPILLKIVHFNQNFRNWLILSEITDFNQFFTVNLAHKGQFQLKI